jgi:hypothetical protein
LLASLRKRAQNIWQQAQLSIASAESLIDNSISPVALTLITPMLDPTLQHEHRMYLAARSEVSLERMCALLENNLSLEPFKHDSEDTWVYARSAGAGFGFNITQTEDTGTIATWMQTAPRNVNYQVILSYHGTPDEAAFQRVRSALQQALGTELQVYHVT